MLLVVTFFQIPCGVALTYSTLVSSHISGGKKGGFMLSGIKNMFNGMKKGMRGFGKGMSNGLKSGLRSMQKGIKGGFNGFSKGMKNLGNIGSKFQGRHSVLP